jgi:ParB-like chromosome segregation protein Spo0J
MAALAERPDVDEAEETRERVTVWDTGEVLYVHPVASLFPMMSSEELDDLAEDIRQNSQADPIILDQHRQLVDGRNRLEACRRARVSPDISAVFLEDAVAFILSKNVTRRHLSKGQAAMAVAQAGRFASNQRATARTLGLSQPRLAYAMVVLEHAPDLVGTVLSGAMGLDEAYREATNRKRAAESEEAQMAELRLKADDLAALVVEGRLTLAEAAGALRKREENAAAHRQATTKLVASGLLAFDPGAWTSGDRATALWEAFDPALLPPGQEVTVERLRACAAVLEQLIARVEGTVDEQR